MQSFRFRSIVIVLALIFACSFNVSAQSSISIEVPKSAEKPPENRIFGVLPNYRTTNADQPYSPITDHRKLWIASRDSFDWPTYPLAAVMTFMMPGKEETKAYGNGWSGFGNRYVRNLADQTIGNMLTEGFLPAILHDDPRYFRPGTGSFWLRMRTAVSQIVITRKDSGKRTFNTPEFLGNGIAVAISNSYSPNLRTWGSSSEKLGLMIATDMVANVIKEFAPDLKERFLHRNRL